MRERYWIESAPGYIRLRHELGLKGPLSRYQWLLHGGESFDEGQEGWVRPTGVVNVDTYPESPEELDEDAYYAELAADPFEEEMEALAEMAYLDSLDDDEREWYEKYGTLEKAKKAAADRVGRGAGGMSARSRAEMWRRVLSLPFDLLGDRPLWITLTYPRDWRRWVPDGRALEAHRRAFGERWRRAFGPPIGFWTKEFQLAEGRPHLHLLMKDPEQMPDSDYRGFQERTRLAKANERNFGRYQGRAKTDIIGMKYGGPTAMTFRNWWSEIVTGNTNARHHARGVDVRTVFYSHNDAIAQSKRRAAIAAYMAGETAKFGQKVPPLEFGTVGNYFGQWGRLEGFRPQVAEIEVDRGVWDEMNRRLTFLQGWRREVKRAQGVRVSESWRKRRSWQGLTMGGLGPEDFAKLLARSTAAMERKKSRSLGSPEWAPS